jgi:hypothetical protein
MRVISSKAHGALDYTVALFMIIAPWFIRDMFKPAAVWTPVIIGCITILYSTFTNYEESRFRIIPFKIHLVLDFIGALVLIASPWLFGFRNQIYLPHVIVGFLEIMVVLFTDPVAFHSKTIEARNKANLPAHAQ